MNMDTLSIQLLTMVSYAEYEVRKLIIKDVRVCAHGVYKRGDVI